MQTPTQTKLGLSLHVPVYMQNKIPTIYVNEEKIEMQAKGATHDFKG